MHAVQPHTYAFSFASWNPWLGLIWTPFLSFEGLVGEFLKKKKQKKNMSAPSTVCAGLVRVRRGEVLQSNVHKHQASWRHPCQASTNTATSKSRLRAIKLLFPFSLDPLLLFKGMLMLTVAFLFPCSAQILLRCRCCYLHLPPELIPSWLCLP